MKNLGEGRARWIRFRIGVLSSVMGLFLGAVISTAYRVQVEEGTSWRETAEKQRQRRLHLEPKRGTIYDRNGTVLAVSVEVPSVSLDVVEMLRPHEPRTHESWLRETSARLATGLSLDAGELYAKMRGKPRFLWLKRRVSSEEATWIRELGDPKKQANPVRGLSIEGEGHRYYPARELAGTVLGFVAPDGQGKDGLELSLDEELRGRVEEVKGLRDRAGRLLFSEGTSGEQALSGRDVTLTLDSGIQHVAERELASAQRTYETKGASLVVVDPNTGDVLALASTPGYNPNDYTESEVDARRDRAITDRFEPGSAMKVFTFATAIAAGVQKPTEPIYCEHGSYQVANVTIHDTHLNDWLTPTQVLAKSSNIGALKVGLSLGEPGLYSGLRRFGFGEPTGIPLPGEASGVLRPKGRPWYEVETANASFGQGISVTTIQLAMAMSAIANGGRLLEPTLVKRVTDARGTVLREGTTHIRREVVPPGVAKTLADMLTAVTEDGGTAVEASVSGFRVAGKTSTAQKVDPQTGKYSQDKYTAVFVGFLPAEKPRLVIAIVLDEPMIGRYGGDLAGPVFRRVAEASLRYLGITPQQTVAKLSGVKREGDPADQFLTTMKQSNPAPVVDLPGEIQPGNVKVPDTSGLGAHDTVEVLSKLGLLPQVEGLGRAVRQMPPPGTSVVKGTTVRVVFEPAS